MALLADFPNEADRGRVARQLEVEQLRLEQQQAPEQVQWVRAGASRRAGFNALRTARSAAAHL